VAFDPREMRSMWHDLQRQYREVEQHRHSDLSVGDNCNWTGSGRDVSCRPAIAVTSIGVRQFMVALSGHEDPINHLAFAPDGRLLASGGDDGCIWLWDVPNRAPVARLSWGAKYVFALAFSPDGRMLAVGTDASLLLLREQEGTWKPIQQ